MSVLRLLPQAYKATKQKFFHAFLLLKTYTSFFPLYRTRLCSQRNLLCSKYPELLTIKIHLHIVHSAVYMRHLSCPYFVGRPEIKHYSLFY